MPAPRTIGKEALPMTLQEQGCLSEESTVAMLAERATWKGDNLKESNP